MEIFHSVRRSEEPLAAALGFFDGLHLGHKAVIDAVLEEKNKGLKAAVITFSAHPMQVLRGEEPFLLMTNEEKLRILEEWGVDRVYLLDFSALVHMEAERFIREILLEQLQVKSAGCGYNFRFGRNGAGDAALLERLFAQSGARTRIMQPVQADGQVISSTAIRALLAKGEMEKAARFLGRPFSYTLEVIHGNHLGRQMGTPTLNQCLPENFIRPRFGVYASRGTVDGVCYPGVTNVGVKPTVGSDKVLSETWLSGFEEDLYGKEVKVELLAFIREERKFSGLEELKQAILRDRESAEQVLKNF